MSSTNTTSIEAAAERFRAGGVLAIIRGRFEAAALLAIAGALRDAGLTAMEVTLNSPGAADHIAALRAQFGTSMLIGAGTVRTAAQVDEAIAAGAEFLVSPGFDAASVVRSRAAGVLHLPGVLTPSEAQQAAIAGCRMLKLFPADAFGPGYLKSIRAPLDDVDFVPTGGVTADNIAAWRSAGAVAVAAGSTLIRGPDQPIDEVFARATAMRQAWESARG